MKHTLATALLLTLVPGLAFAQSSDTGVAPDAPSSTGAEATAGVRVGDEQPAATSSPRAPRPAPQPAPTWYNPQPPTYRYGGYAPSDWSGSSYDYRPPRRREVDYEGGAIPPGARLAHRPTSWLVTTGAVALGSFYGMSLLYALTTCGAQQSCREGSGWLYVPVFGPFITSAMAPSSGGQALAAFDGAVQTLGLAALIAGFAIQRPVLVFTDYARNGRGRRPQFGVAPTAGAAGTGLSFSMTHF